MKTLLILALLGADVGIAVASFAAPRMLAWYSAPAGLPNGAQIQTIVDISAVIRHATGQLIRYQMLGAALGAAGGVALGVFMRTRGKKPASGPAADPAAAPKPAPKP